MSHATSLWLCRSDLEPAVLAAALREHAPRLAQSRAFVVHATRASPPATVVTAFLDAAPELEVEFELLDAAAASLAATYGVRAYRLYAFAGSASELRVKAFDPAGARWEMAHGDSDDSLDPDDPNTQIYFDDAFLEELREKRTERRAVLETLTATFGDAVEREGMAHEPPYWRLWAEQSPTPECVLSLGVKPPLEFEGRGWSKVTELALAPAPRTR